MQGLETILRPWLLLKWDGSKRKYNCAQILDIFWKWSQQDLLTDLIQEKTKESGIIPRYVAWASGKDGLAISGNGETWEGAGLGEKTGIFFLPKMFGLRYLLYTPVEWLVVWSGEKGLGYRWTIGIYQVVCLWYLKPWTGRDHQRSKCNERRRGSRPSCETFQWLETGRWRNKDKGSWKGTANMLGEKNQGQGMC